MTLTVEATYENGVLRPKTPLALREHESVVLTVRSARASEPATGVIACTDPALVEWAALNPELEYPPPGEAA